MGAAEERASTLWQPVLAQACDQGRPARVRPLLTPDFSSKGLALLQRGGHWGLRPDPVGHELGPGLLLTAPTWPSEGAVSTACAQRGVVS